jgi:hypothetical protein
MGSDVSVAPLLIAAALYALAVGGSGWFPFARDFRVACVSFAIVGIAGAVLLPGYAWHLLWYTPVTIVAAYFYSLRGLLALSRRLNRLGRDGVVDPEQIRRSIQDAVKDFNEGRDENQRLK